MKDFVLISDVHGRYTELNKLLSDCREYLGTHKIIFLGDYLGGGSKPLETLELIKWLKESMNAVVLRGNWEDMLSKAFFADNPKQKAWAWKMLAKHETTTTDALRKNPTKALPLVEFFSSLPALHYESGWMFTHAGVDPTVWRAGMTPYKFGQSQSEENILWNSAFYDSAEKCSVLPFNVVSGHVPIGVIAKRLGRKIKWGEPFVEGNVYGIDFSASQSFGSLGAVVITDGKYDVAIKEKIAAN